MTEQKKCVCVRAHTHIHTYTFSRMEKERKIFGLYRFEVDTSFS